MATLRSVLLRWVFAVALFSSSLIFMGATFAPSSFLSQICFDPVRPDPLMEKEAVFALGDERPFSRHSAVLSRLREMVLTERVIATSA